MHEGSSTTLRGVSTAPREHFAKLADFGELSESARAGTTIGHGTYTIEHAIGRGGMGTVFAGVHNWTGRKVAIKVLRREVTDGVDAARILQEARAATSIDHAHVVEVLDMGRDDDGSVYLVFERLVGCTLAERIERDGALGVEETTVLLLPILDALAVAHELGIIHRDIKPENIFLESTADDGVRAKLLDFGLAKMERSNVRRTNSGTVVGTPAYMSPERAHGRRDVGPATDVWSMGVVLHECLRGRPLFEAAHPMGVLLAIVNDPVPTLAGHPGVSDAIAGVVAAALQRELDERLPDARALRDAWAHAAGVPVVAGRVSGLPPDWHAGAAALPLLPRPSRAAAGALCDAGEVADVDAEMPPTWLRSGVPIRLAAPTRTRAATFALVTCVALLAFALVAFEKADGRERPAVRVAPASRRAEGPSSPPAPLAAASAPLGPGSPGTQEVAAGVSAVPERVGPAHVDAGPVVGAQVGTSAVSASAGRGLVLPARRALSWPRASANPPVENPPRASAHRRRTPRHGRGVVMGRNGAPIFD